MQDSKLGLSRVLLFSAALFAAFCQHVFAGVQYWDNNGLGAPTSGTWDTTTADWSSTSALTASPAVWNPANAAVFPAGSANAGTLTISVPGSVGFAGIFNGNSLANNTGFGVTNLIFTGSGPLSLNSGLQGFWMGSNQWNTIIRVPISGLGGVQNQSGGSLYLSANNTYSGGFSFGSSAGVNINSGNVFGTGTVTNSVSTSVIATPATDSSGSAFATGPITIPNAWQTFGGTSSEIFVGLAAAPITFTGPWTLMGAAATTTTLDMRNTTFNISGAISGPANLTKANSTGTLILSGPNTYTGKTIISGGTLSVSSLNKVSGGSASSSLGAPTTVANGTIGIGASTTAGTLVYTGAGETTDRVIDLAATTGGATIQNDGTGGLTFSTDFTASGAGAKTLTLQGANTGNNTILGKIVDSTLSTAFTKAGAGKWILSGANTYSGNTTVSAGTLVQGAANVIPFGTGKGTFAVSSGATFDMGGFDCSVDGFGTSAGTIDNTIGGGSYTLTIGNNNGGGTHSGPIKNSNGAVSVTKTGTGSVVLSSSTSTYSGKTIVNSGTLTINNAETALGTPPGSPVADQLTLNNGTTFALGSAANVTLNANRGITVSGSATINLTSKDLTVPGIIAGTGSLTKSGGNALILSGANTFSGGVTLTGGTLTVNNNSALGTGSVTITPAGICTIAGKSGATVLANPITVNAGGGQVIDFFATSGNSLTLNGQISGTASIFRGNGGGAGPLAINADNSTYSGTLTLQQGPLVLGNKNALGTGTFVVTPGAVAISFAANTSLTGANSVGNPTTLNGILPVTTTSDLELSGVLSGTGGVTKGGTGKLILSAANTYSGATAVTNGTLLVNNTSGSGTGSGAVTVQTGGTLGGTGDIAGTVTVNSTGNLSPGSSIGTLTLDVPPVLNGTTIMEIDRNGGSPLADRLVVSSGVLTYGGVLNLVNLGASLRANDTFALFVAPSFAASFSSVTPSPGPGLVWDTSRLTVDGTIKAVCAGTLAANAGAAQTTCSGSGVAIGGSPTASGGSGTGYTYSWSPTTGLNDPTLANPTASPSSTTTYTVTVTDAVGCTAQASVSVSVDVPPAITSQPANQTACSGTTASFTVTASGSGLAYSWAKHSNGGWGSPWATSGSGSTFRGSSTDDDFGDTACTSFTSAFDINSPSGNALGMWGGFGGDEVATRSFVALSSGQSVSIDFDNGNVDSGSKVGFSLQTSGGADILQFYFLGGQSNYKYNDGSEQDTGIPFQRTGLRVQFILTSATTYSLIVTPCGGTAANFSGTYSGTIAQLKLFSQNTTGGNDKNIYFNNFIVGGYVDNADNYSGDYAGQDKGDQPIAAGNGGNNYTTPVLSTADNGAQYEVVVSGCSGTVLSSAATLTVNAAPTASTGGNQTICAGSSTVGLGGSVGGGATGGLWSSSGTGTFVPDATTLNATYTPSPADVAAGTVTLTLTTTGQLAPCTAATAQVVVTINPAATASAGPNQTICAGSSTAGLGGSVGGGAMGGAWSTSGSGTFAPDATTLNATYTPSAADISAGSVTLTLTSTGQLAPCPAATAQVVVTINPAATASAGGNQTICAGSSTAGLGGSVGGGATGGTWSSSGTGTFSPNSTTLNAVYNPSAADISAGTVTLTLTTAGQLAPCPAATAQVVVTINAAATASAGGNQTICSGNSTAGLAGSVGGGATGGIWSSSGTGTFSPDASTLNATYVPSAADNSAGTVTLTLTTTGQVAPCQPATAQVVVTINASPAITAAPTNLTVCAGSPAVFQVTATGARLTYQWQVSGDAGTTFTNISDTATNAAYTNVVTAIADNGNQYQVIVSGTCSPAVTSAPVVLTVNTPATASAGPNQSICDGNNTAGLGGSVGGGATGGLWSSSGTGTFVPDATTLNASYTPSAADIAAGSVTLTLTSTGQAAPCGAATAQVVVTINPAPVANAGPDLMVCPNRPVVIGGSPTASGAAGPFVYLWSPATGLSDPTAANPSATITDATTYTVTVSDTNGCTGTDSVVLSIPPNPVIQSITMSGTAVTLVWSSVPGQTYRVQYKADLNDPTWTDLAPDVTASGTTASTIDSVGAATQRFYRVSFVCP